MIFKVALCLLSSHEAEIVECDGFESIVDYLKTTLPALSQAQMEQTIVKVATRRSNAARAAHFQEDDAWGGDYLSVFETKKGPMLGAMNSPSPPVHKVHINRSTRSVLALLFIVVTRKLKRSLSFCGPLKL